jgi:hypothetical protein
VDDPVTQAQASDRNHAAVDGVLHVPSTARSGRTAGGSKWITAVAVGVSWFVAFGPVPAAAPAVATITIHARMTAGKVPIVHPPAREPFAHSFK